MNAQITSYSGKDKFSGIQMESKQYWKKLEEKPQQNKPTGSQLKRSKIYFSLGHKRRCKQNTNKQTNKSQVNSYSLQAFEDKSTIFPPPLEHCKPVQMVTGNNPGPWRSREFCHVPGWD